MIHLCNTNGNVFIYFCKPLSSLYCACTAYWPHNRLADQSAAQTASFLPPSGTTTSSTQYHSPAVAHLCAACKLQGYRAAVADWLLLSGWPRQLAAAAAGLTIPEATPTPALLQALTGFQPGPRLISSKNKRRGFSGQDVRASYRGREQLLNICRERKGCAVLLG